MRNANGGREQGQWRWITETGTDIRGTTTTRLILEAMKGDTGGPENARWMPENETGRKESGKEKLDTLKTIVGKADRSKRDLRMLAVHLVGEGKGQ